MVTRHHISYFSNVLFICQIKLILFLGVWPQFCEVLTLPELPLCWLGNFFLFYKNCIVLVIAHLGFYCWIQLICWSILDSMVIFTKIILEILLKTFDFRIKCILNLFLTWIWLFENYLLAFTNRVIDENKGIIPSLLCTLDHLSIRIPDILIVVFDSRTSSATTCLWKSNFGMLDCLIVERVVWSDVTWPNWTRLVLKSL